MLLGRVYVGNITFEVSEQDIRTVPPSPPPSAPLLHPLPLSFSRSLQRLRTLHFAIRIYSPDLFSLSNRHILHSPLSAFAAIACMRAILRFSCAPSMSLFYTSLYPHPTLGHR